ncbi:MAG: secretion protein HlyD, partial [Stellaceae bacterium]
LPVVLVVGFLAWRQVRGNEDRADHLTLYGNVDVRQVDLSFKVAGRIAALGIDEGDAVKAGQVLGSLEKSYFDDDVRLGLARAGAQAANLLKLKNGSRPQEIEQAQAALAERKASLANAQINFARQAELLRSHVASQQAFDNAQMILNTARAQVQSAQAALDLAVAGPRREDIAAAQAQLDTEQARLVETRRRLADADLVAPNDGVVQTRAREPGAIVQPGETVFTLTLNRPVWVRAYVDEPDLARVKPGMAMLVRGDAPGGKSYRGIVGFISPLAEFTPKSVETTELRTDLVYRLRIIVSDPDSGLRQGMPVTVTQAAGN